MMPEVRYVERNGVSCKIMLPLFIIMSFILIDTPCNSKLIYITCTISSMHDNREQRLRKHVKKKLQQAG